MSVGAIDRRGGLDIVKSGLSGDWNDGIMGDDVVKREMWDGKIPVCFKLDEEDVMMTVRGDRAAPEPCYVSEFTCDYLRGVEKELVCDLF